MKLRIWDVVVTAGVAIFLLGVTFVAREQAREMQAIAQCAQSLKRIGGAIAQYRTDHGTLPRTRYTPGAPVTAYTGASARDPFSEAGPTPNDVTAAAYLLARTQDLPPEAFVCFAAQRHGLAELGQWDATTVRERSNFDARVHYNYSLLNPYTDDANRELLPDEMIGADTNPGSQPPSKATTQMSQVELRMGNSLNHQRNGQNVLFGDGRVEFAATPFVGKTLAHVYADDRLLPTWQMGPRVTPTNVLIRRWVFSAALVLTIGGLAYFVYRNRRRDPPLAT